MGQITSLNHNTRENKGKIGELAHDELHRVMDPHLYAIVIDKRLRNSTSIFNAYQIFRLQMLQFFVEAEQHTTFPQKLFTIFDNMIVKADYKLIIITK